MTFLCLHCDRIWEILPDATFKGKTQGATFPHQQHWSSGYSKTYTVIYLKDLSYESFSI